MFYAATTLDDEELFGWTLIGTICVVFITNLVVMTVITIQGVKRKLYVKKMKAKQKKAIEEMQER